MHNHFHDVHTIKIPNINTEKPLVTVTETTKISEIKDINGNLRYKVFLSDYTPDAASTKCYQVEVVDYFYSSEPLIIDIYPSSETATTDFTVALNKYNEYIRHYSTLIRAELTEMQSHTLIDADRVSYKKADIQCCLTCKHCRQEQCPEVYQKEDHVMCTKFVCTCPENTISFKDPHKIECTDVKIDALPQIELDHVCKWYYNRDLKALPAYKEHVIPHPLHVAKVGHLI